MLRRIPQVVLSSSVLWVLLTAFLWAQPDIELRFDWRMGTNATVWSGSPAFLQVSIQPKTLPWTALHFVDSIGSQLFLPSSALQLQWQDSLRQFFVFAFSPRIVSQLPQGRYQIRCEVRTVTGQQYRSNSIWMEKIVRDTTDSLQLWQERWRIVHWLMLRGLSEQARRAAEQLFLHSPPLALKELTRAYLRKEPPPTVGDSTSISFWYQREWRYRWQAE